LTGPRNVHALQEFGVAHYVGSFSMRDLPFDFAFIQINGRDGSVRRLDQWQTVDIQPHILAGRSLLGRLRRIGASVFARPVTDLDLLSRDAGAVPNGSTVGG